MLTFCSFSLTAGDGKSQEEIKLARRRLSTMNDKAGSADDLSVSNMSLEDEKVC